MGGPEAMNGISSEILQLLDPTQGLCYVSWAKFNRFTELHPLASPKRLTDLIAMNLMLSVRDK